jgi:hypothetical protein
VESLHSEGFLKPEVSIGAGKVALVRALLGMGEEVY